MSGSLPSVPPEGHGGEANMYFYLDEESKGQHGPYTVGQMRERFEDGIIDGLTLVSCPQDGPDFKPLAEITELKAAITGSCEDEGGTEEDGMQQPQPAAAAASAPASATATAQYFYEEGGKQQGPLTLDALRAMMDGGYLQPQTLCWRPGLEGWQPASAIAELTNTASAAVTTATENGATSSEAAGRKRSRAEMEGSSATDASGTAGAKPPKRSNKGGRSSNNNAATWVTVTGLSPDVTVDDLQDYFKRAGLIAMDLITGKPKILLSTSSSSASSASSSSSSSEDSEQAPSPYATRIAHICFLKEASVELALTLLDDTDIKPGVRITVEPATSDPEAASSAVAKRGKGGKGSATAIASANTGSFRSFERALAGSNLTKEEIAQVRAREAQQRAALSWAEEGNEDIGIRTVVLRNVFDPREFIPDPSKGLAGVAEARQDLEDLEEDMASEAVRYGDVEKLVVFSKHPEGIVTIKFVSSGAAADCLSAMNGRFFGGRKIAASFHDGMTDYRPPEMKGAANVGAGQAGKAYQPEDDEDEVQEGEEGKHKSSSSANDDEDKRLDDFGSWLESETGAAAAVPETQAGNSEH